MQVYTAPSGRVLHVAQQHTTSLQSLEGTELKLTFLTELPDLAQGLQALDLCYDGYTFLSVEPGKKLLESELLTLKKIELLLQVEEMIGKIRHSHSKILIAQDVVYHQKLEEALALLENRKLLDELPFMQDEVEIRKVEPKIAALEVRRQHSEGMAILRTSERARRILTERIARTKTLQELEVLSLKIVERTFKVKDEI